MSLQGWGFMLIVWGLVGGLFFYSFYRILFDSRIRGTGQKNPKGKDKNHERGGLFPF
jgi:hypothetical protein